MASNYPNSTDSLLPGNVAGDTAIKAAIDQIQATHQREKMLQGTANPAPGGTVTPDMTLGSVGIINMPAGNITIANPLNPTQGDMLTIGIVQDSVGGRTVTWGSAFRKSLTLSTAANAVDIVTFRYLSGLNRWYQLSSALGVS